MEEKNVFEYKYSAKQQEEVDAIKKKYLPREEKAKELSKLEELKKLDKKVEMTATLWAIAVGVIGTLIFGTGMSMAMQLIGNSMALGIIIGIIGMAGCAVNYPIYKKMLAKGKAKYAYEIVELAREISEQ